MPVCQNQANIFVRALLSDWIKNIWYGPWFVFAGNGGLPLLGYRSLWRKSWRDIPPFSVNSSCLDSNFACACIVKSYANGNDLPVMDGEKVWMNLPQNGGIPLFVSSWSKPLGRSSRYEFSDIRLGNVGMIKSLPEIKMTRLKRRRAELPFLGQHLCENLINKLEKIIITEVRDQVTELHLHFPPLLHKCIEKSNWARSTAKAS